MSPRNALPSDAPLGLILAMAERRCSYIPWQSLRRHVLPRRERPMCRDVMGRARCRDFAVVPP
jgi:hypothetical protein